MEAKDVFVVNEKGILTKKEEFKYSPVSIESSKYEVPFNAIGISDSCFKDSFNVSVILHDGIKRIYEGGLMGCKNIYCNLETFKHLLIDTSVFGTYDIVHVYDTNYYMYCHPNITAQYLKHEDIVDIFKEEDDNYSWFELINYALNAGGHVHELFVDGIENCDENFFENLLKEDVVANEIEDAISLNGETNFF